jgi:hypothetical protein
MYNTVAASRNPVATAFIRRTPRRFATSAGESCRTLTLSVERQVRVSGSAAAFPRYRLGGWQAAKIGSG